MKIYNGYERLSRNYNLMTDMYQLSMANSYLKSGKQEDEAVFDAFFRKVPNNGGYAVMAGIDKIIPYIQNLKFDEEQLEALERQGFDQEFIHYMRNFKFTGDIYAIPDGTPIFPNEPLITVKAPLIEAQLIETTLLTMMNGAMEHATGARRIIEATPENVGVMEFGARRADGPEAAIDSSIYGIMAGCMGTSNVMAADMLNRKALGTMAHSFIESFDTEYEAFLAYAKTYPDNCVLLVDTYDTLKSGVPNAIKVAKDFLIPNGYKLKGIRIDSGKLEILSKEAKRMFDKAGEAFKDTQICLSNGLNAEKIEDLKIKQAVANTYGTGDNISKPEGRMGCVYKLVELNDKPRIKLSNDTIKIINPAYKNIFRAYDKNTGFAIADIMSRKGMILDSNSLTIVDPQNKLNNMEIENYQLEELQKPIFLNGELVYNDPDIEQKKAYCKEQMERLYPEVRATTDPNNYYVSGTEEYVIFKNDFIEKTKQLVKTKMM